MHRRAFQALKRTFMHVSCLPTPYFNNKTKYFINQFLSEYGGERPETCINMRFMTWNARLFMCQVFPHHILIIKLIYKVFVFFIEIWWGKTWDMHKRAIQALKRTFMHVSCLPTPYFDNKTKYFINQFLSEYGGERPETCINVRFMPWNARLIMSQVFPHHILIKKLIYKVFGFFYRNMVGEDLRHA